MCAGYLKSSPRPARRGVPPTAGGGRLAHVSTASRQQRRSGAAGKRSCSTDTQRKRASVSATLILYPLHQYVSATLLLYSLDHYVSTASLRIHSVTTERKRRRRPD